jgi:acyl carrier protein
LTTCDTSLVTATLRIVALTDKEVLDKIQPIFRDVLDLPSLVVGRGDSAPAIEGWDSLAHINLVSSIEQEFGIHFALGELAELENVGDMVDLIVGKLAKRS